MVELIKKWGIGEVAVLIGVSKATLKAWSDRNYIPKPHRFTTDLRRGRYWFEDEVKAIYEYRQRNYQY